MLPNSPQKWTSSRGVWEKQCERRAGLRLSRPWMETVDTVFCEKALSAVVATLRLLSAIFEKLVWLQRESDTLACKFQYFNETASLVAAVRAQLVSYGRFEV